jgi:hypothetical protein
MNQKSVGVNAVGMPMSTHALTGEADSLAKWKK